jgi:DNA-binding response OmpR family regulator
VQKPNESPPATVLLVERDVLIRTSVARYLRECGYRVIEAANTDEATTVLRDPTVNVDALVADAAAPGSQNGFALARWAKDHRSSLKTMIVGTPERVAATASALCEEGPSLSKPYDPSILHDQIRRLIATRGT